MKKKKLVKEIIDFCFTYGLIDETVKTYEMEIRIENALKQCAFIETLYNIILLETKKNRNANIKRTRELLLQLEELRLQLEFETMESEGQKC